MAPANLRATAGAYHRSLGLLTPVSARSTSSCGLSWKIWVIVSWPSPHHLQAGPTSRWRRLSYERRARWCPYRRRARCTRSCRCRSASSGLVSNNAVTMIALFEMLIQSHWLVTTPLLWLPYLKRWYKEVKRYKIWGHRNWWYKYHPELQTTRHTHSSKATLNQIKWALDGPLTNITLEV